MFFNHTQHSHVHILSIRFWSLFTHYYSKKSIYFFAIVKFIFFVFLYLKVNNIKSYVLLRWVTKFLRFLFAWKRNVLSGASRFFWEPTTVRVTSDYALSSPKEKEKVWSQVSVHLSFCYQRRGKRSHMFQLALITSQRIEEKPHLHFLHVLLAFQAF